MPKYPNKAWERKHRPFQAPPYTLVEKVIHGQKVLVKVYQPFEDRDDEVLEGHAKNRFSRERGMMLERKCRKEKKAPAAKKRP